MPTLEPSLALNACENALRELMTHCYSQAYGKAWLSRVSTDRQRSDWENRAETESKARTTKGVAAVPNAGLAYANFYDLVTIAEKHWQPLSAALGQQKKVVPLLQRFDSLRNTVGHNRALLSFEQELLSGIAGQIRNQVTLFMSAQDEVGDIYPRIESIMDSFGRRIDSDVVAGEVAGTVGAPKIVVHPGDTVTFICLGLDPQDRPLQWSLQDPDYTEIQNTIGESGKPTILTWNVQEKDVREHGSIGIYMRAHEAKYRRFAHFDHRAHFYFWIRPPQDAEEVTGAQRK